MATTPRGPNPSSCQRSPTRYGHVFIAQKWTDAFLSPAAVYKRGGALTPARAQHTHTPAPCRAMSRLHSLRQRLARELAPVAPVDVARGPVRRSSLPTLTDTFGRAHTYLRISLTERCSLRCTYCMPPSGVALTRSEELLTRGETVRLATLFVTSGVTKIRLTGGEPTLRPDLPELLGSLSALRPLGLESLCMTSNGVSLSRSLGALKDAGLDRLNLSLDTLRRERFKEITRRDALPKVKQKTNKKHMFFSLSLNVAPPLLPYVHNFIPKRPRGIWRHKSVPQWECGIWQNNGWQHGECDEWPRKGCMRRF